ncbi:hypothetical protein [Nonomuraea insulae]|uniref:Uncharacterized protein n=1 Tax=Nonomuraea insulae TaxID=1616787 RepID=A0ABW1CBU0_9ACTN
MAWPKLPRKPERRSQAALLGKNDRRAVAPAATDHQHVRAL